MKLANKAYVIALLLLALAFTVSAQTPRSSQETRNLAPTVGTGGPVGGPTGLFTVYDGQTIRKGEFTFSAAYSNYDRDPGNVDISDIPLSFQVGLSDHVEIFFSTTAYRGIKVNGPRNLSSFYLPNSKVFIGAGFTSGPAIILAPRGPNPPLVTGAVYRPTGTQPFVPFNYVGGSVGSLGLQFPFTSGPSFGYGPGSALMTAVASGGSGADNFPGTGSVYGSILPGIVLQTTPLFTVAGAPSGSAPSVFTLAPSYLPDAPFVNHQWGESAFNDYSVGAKWRWTGPNNPIGVGMVAYYEFYDNLATGLNGFRNMQRGAGPGGNRGDFGVTLFGDARLRKWLNVSANIGYKYTATVKGDIGGTTFKLLDRGDEFSTAVGVDFPINKWVQPIFEFRSLKYVGGRTPNAFENNPMDAIAGLRYFPRSWFGVGGAYRWHANEQDKESFDGSSAFSTSVLVLCRPNQTGCTPQTITNTYRGVPPGFQASENPHGFIVQAWIGRRNSRENPVKNLSPNVNDVTISDYEVALPCPPGTKSTADSCAEATNLGVQTSASDPEGDVMTYNYTVSGGRIVGQGANVNWDVSGLAPGQYTITAGVNDGCGVCGATKTKTITVRNCSGCIVPCDCGTLKVIGPAGITEPGYPMTFTANVTGGPDVTYNWSVSSGTIESGQGTSSIVVATTKEMAGTNVTATVELGGTDPACHCQTNDSETAGIDTPPEKQIVDTYGAAKDDEVKPRVDNFYIDLLNHPGSHGVIINYGTPAEIKRRKAQIYKAITFLKRDPSLITMVDGPNRGNGIETVFWRVPEGADYPTP